MNVVFDTNIWYSQFGLRSSAAAAGQRLSKLTKEWTGQIRRLCVWIYEQGVVFSNNDAWQ